MNNRNSNKTTTYVFVLMVLLLAMGTVYFLSVPIDVTNTTEILFTFLGQSFALLAGYLVGQNSSKARK